MRTRPISSRKVVADEIEAHSRALGGSAPDFDRVVPDHGGVLATLFVGLTDAGGQVVILLLVDPHLDEILYGLVGV